MLFSINIPRPPTPTLFPYTTLFRSRGQSCLVCKEDLGNRRNGVGDSRYQGQQIPELAAICLSQRFANSRPDRKSTRLNSSHVEISYAVFCLKKKTRRDAGGGAVAVV